MEFVLRCKLCPFVEAWDDEHAMMAAGIWHTHDAHPDVYAKQAQGLPPIEGAVPRPEVLGTRFEDWERQS